MNMGTCIVFYKSHWSHSHSNIQLVPSRIILGKGWMRASISFLARGLSHEVSVLSFRFLRPLHQDLIDKEGSSGRACVLSVGFVKLFHQLHLLLRCIAHSFRLTNEFVLVSFFLLLWRVHLLQIFFVSVEPCLKPLKPHTKARLVDFMIHCFVQNRKG